MIQLGNGRRTMGSPAASRANTTAICTAGAHVGGVRPIAEPEALLLEGLDDALRDGVPGRPSVDGGSLGK